MHTSAEPIDDAIQHLKQLVQDNEARYLLGLAYFQKEDFTQAIPHFEAVIKRESRHAKAHFNLGNCYLRTGKIAEGRTHSARLRNSLAKRNNWHHCNVWSITIHNAFSPVMSLQNSL